MMNWSSNISYILPHLWLCGMSDINEPNLTAFEITHVLNTAIELRDFTYPDIAGLNVKHIVFEDDEEENLLEHLDDCVDHIHKAIGEGGNVLVHCIGGVSRSASVIVAYLVKYEKKTLREAYFHVLNSRRGVSPNLGFWKQLMTYEEKHRGSNSVEISGSVPTYMKEMAE